jgi:ABC-type glycerol-3-phosphate transport system substrate-binding protein
MIRARHFNWDIITLTQKYYNDIGKELNDPEWGKKYLVNFEDFDWFRESHNPLVFEVQQYRDDLGGIFAGPLIEGRYYSLWYNTNTAKKIGLQIKPTGMTFDDFKGYIKRAYEYNQTTQEKIQILYSKSNYMPVPELLNSLVLSALGTIDTLKIDLPKGLAALKRALKACESLSVYNPIDPTIKLDDKTDAMLEEKVLFGVYVSSFINNWEAIDKAKAENMVPAELPVFERPCIFFHGSYQSVWAVFKDAPHRDEAIKFMQYMCSNDIAEKWISTTKNPTAIKVRINASDLAQDEIAKFNTAIEKKYGKNIRNYNIAQILFGPKSTITIDSTQVVSGELTANQYYDQIVKQLKKQK